MLLKLIVSAKFPVILSTLSSHVICHHVYSTLRIDVVMDKQPQNLKVCYADKYKRRVWALSNIGCKFDKEGVNCAGTESEQTVGVFACSIANTSLDYQGD